MEAFLSVFEQTTLWENWCKDEWAWALAPLLSGQAQRAYFFLSPQVVDEYQCLKEEILAQCSHFPHQVSREFHCRSYSVAVTPRNQMDTLLCTTKC